MAAREDDECKMKITKWILEYSYAIAWDSFKVSKSVDVGGIRDLVQWLGSHDQILNQLKSYSLVLRIQLLIIFARLTDGPDYGTRYHQDQEFTVLEDLLSIFRTLKVSPTIQKEYKQAVLLIMKQAVLVCCRNDDFTEGQMVFDRLWKEDNEPEHKFTKEKLEKLLSTKNKGNFFAVNNNYDSFLDKMLAFLTLIDKDFGTPELVMIGRAYTKMLKSSKTKDTLDLSNVRKVPASVVKAMASKSGVADVSKPEADGGSDCSIDRTREKRIQTWLQDVSPKKKMRLKLGSLEDNEESDSSIVNHEDIVRSPEMFRYRKNYSRPDRHKATNGNDNSDKESPFKSPFKSPVKSPNRNNNTKTVPKRPPSPSGSSIYGSIRRKWTTKETEDFYQAIQESGVGQWASIKMLLGTERSSVNLKDKWRTLNHNGEINDLIKKFGPV